MHGISATREIRITGSLRARVLLVTGLLIAWMSVSAMAADSCPAEAQMERDEILALTAQAMVYQDWQDSPKGRGHNIGSILVNQQHLPVFWARNSVTREDDASQHGEVRLIQAFLQCEHVGKYAEHYTVYTTLEPCAMCTGLMSMAKVSRVVYLQADPDYGNVHNALLATKYPRIYAEYSPAALQQKSRLEAGFTAFMKLHPDASITDYLLTPEAKSIFASAIDTLQAYKLRFAENEAVLAGAKQFLAETRGEQFEAARHKRCPTAP